QAAPFKAPTAQVKSYPTDPGFVAASVELVKEGLAQAGSGPRRVLFSAHGLPEKVIKAGDPYQSEVEASAAAIAAGVGGLTRGTDWTVCYQSRVGPLKWIGPSTEDEIRRAGAERTNLIVYPVSFVSEHSETLFELDIAYRRLAAEQGVPTYVR